MEPITVRHHAATQYEVLVGRVRVAYVCVGEGMPINFLPDSYLKRQFVPTDAEKIEICEVVREEMAKVNQRLRAESERLNRLIMGRDE